VTDPEAVLGDVPTGVSLRRELAAAARSRGRSSSVADEIDAIEAKLDAIEVEPVDLAAARRRVAAASGETAQLTERVAALRGDAQARRELGAETDATLDALEAAAAELSAAQTERIAAEEALERATAEARRARDERRRRLRLHDRLRNRRRAARRELASATYPEFRSALDAVPGGSPADAGQEPAAYDGPSASASLAAVRIAALDGPVALAGAAASLVDDVKTAATTLLRVDAVRLQGADGVDAG